MQRWRLRKLSGPFALPIFGNLPAIVAMPGGFAMWRNAMFKKYGGLYKVFRCQQHRCIIATHKIALCTLPDALLFGP